MAASRSEPVDLASFVLDSSVAVGWCFTDEMDDYCRDVLRMLSTARALVPPHWAAEFTNALLASERRGRCTPEESLQSIRLVFNLPIRVSAPFDATTSLRTLLTARTHGLATYDAAYLEVASRTGLPLATIDSRLRQAATTLGLFYEPQGSPG